jgi:hypothetical protein
MVFQKKPGLHGAEEGTGFGHRREALWVEGREGALQ